MDELIQRLKVMKKTPHCSNCGTIHPDLSHYSDQDDRGLTLCCNEAVCHMLEEFDFGNETANVRACCWAVAEVQFRIKGVDIHKLSEIRRSGN